MPRRSRSRSASPHSRRRDRHRPRGRSRSRSHSRSRSPPAPRLARAEQPRRSRSRSRTREREPRPAVASTESPPRRRNREKKAQDFSHLIRWGKEEDAQDDKGDGDVQPEKPVEKPNFGLSGALAKDRATGNVQNGVVMKWSEPPEARVPQHRYRLYVFKDDALASTLHVHRKSAFLIGRDAAVADILTEHGSCSKQHAVLQYRLFQKPTADGLDVMPEVRPYIMDLNSTNATFLNGERIESARYIELKVKDVLKFGESTREYVLMDAS